MDLARTAQVAETRQRKCAGGHAAGGLVEPVRDGRLASARADRYVLRQGRRFRLRFGACHRPFSVRGVVTEHQWLTEKQFVDAVAVAMITPGPVVITVAFIGYS